MDQEKLKQRLIMKPQAQRAFDDWSGLFSDERVYQSKLGEVDSTLLPVLLRVTDALMTSKPLGMFLIGPVGTGKTSILWLIRREYMRQVANNMVKGGDDDQIITRNDLDLAADVSWFTHQQLIQALRDSVDDDREMRSLYNRRVLFVDDFLRGFDDKSGWHTTLQFDFFDHRWRKGLPTFITTNRTREQLRALGPDWEATIDRMADPNWMQAFTLSGKSRRTSK